MRANRLQFPEYEILYFLYLRINCGLANSADPDKIDCLSYREVEVQSDTI